MNVEHGANGGRRASGKFGRSASKLLRGWPGRMLAKMASVLLIEYVIMGRGGIVRRIVPPIVGVGVYAAFAAATLTALGSLSAAVIGEWSLLVGPSGWIAAAALGAGTVAIARTRGGRRVAAEVAVRLLLGLPIVLAWALGLCGAVVIVIPSLAVLLGGAMVALTFRAGRRISSLAFPISTFMVFVLAILTARFYGRPLWLQVAGSIIAAIMAYSNATWLFVWTQRPLELLEIGLRKYRESFVLRFAKLISEPESGLPHETFSAAELHKYGAELDSHEKALDFFAAGLRRFTRHRLIFKTFLGTFVAVAVSSVVNYTFAFWLLIAPGGHIVLASESDQRPTLVHAFALSLRALVGDDYSGVEVTSTFATLFILSELVLGLYFFVVLILSFSLATSTHLERMELGAMQVVDELRNLISKLRKRVTITLVIPRDIEDKDGAPPPDTA